MKQWLWTLVYVCLVALAMFPRFRRILDGASLER